MAQSQFAFFPGCSAHSTGRAYTESFMYVAERLGFEVSEIPEWNCCGASAGHLRSRDLGDALPARSLALSEEAFGDRPVLALCAGCYINLRRALVHARRSPEDLARIDGLIGREWKASAEVMNGLEPFMDPEVQSRLSSCVTRPLKGLKVACYYGCAMVRPRDVCAFDDEEDPRSMERILSLTGAEPVEWSFKTECCGASHQVIVQRDMKPMVGRILENAAAAGAEAVATACPLCMLNLDMREAEANRQRAELGKPPLRLPVYYFTELIAASFGGKADEIGIKRHFTPAVETVEAARSQGVVA
ncbi:MAG: CoB--CoM heterodisulfide reductase iron-sulfur subunit B family protein [Coriobacteriales bacterium]|jgi:heterodisulfide reductase subunit B